MDVKQELFEIYAFYVALLIGKTAKHNISPKKMFDH